MLYNNSKVTHVNIFLYLYIWGLLGARQEVITSILE